MIDFRQSTTVTIVRLISDRRRDQYSHEKETDCYCPRAIAVKQIRYLARYTQRKGHDSVGAHASQKRRH